MFLVPFFFVLFIAILCVSNVHSRNKLNILSAIILHSGSLKVLKLYLLFVGKKLIILNMLSFLKYSLSFMETENILQFIKEYFCFGIHMVGVFFQ